MANYDTLKAAIQAAIKQNGNNEITGNLLQQQLLAMVNSLGVGYQFAGIATPTTNPGTPDQRIYYVASTPGTYANFGGIVLEFGEVSVLKYDGAWAKVTTGIANDEKVNQLEQEKQIKTEDSPNNDLSICDDKGNTLARFYDGEFQTKEFNTSHLKIVVDNDDNNDLSICDDKGNTLARFYDGGFAVKNLSSFFIPSILKSYRGKIISILGDSISTFGTPDSRNERGVYCYSYYPQQSCRYSESGDVTVNGATYDSIKFNVNNTWWMKTINKLGAKLGVNDSFRGSSISSIRGVDTAFSNQNRIDHLGLNGTPNLILVYGGTNDAGAGVEIGQFDTTPPPTTSAGIAELGNETFADGVRTMIVRLMYTYPNSEIVVVLPNLTTSYYTIQALDNYIELLREACDFFGIKYVDIRTAGINYYNRNQYFVDGIHPNINGMDLIYNAIYNRLIF